MPNIASVLKQEIARIARKEARAQTSGLKRASVQYRRNISALRSQVANLERRLAVVSKSRPQNSAGAEDLGNKPRFVPKGLRSLRKRLGLTIAELAGLLGVSSQSIYNWERRITRPRAEQLKMLGELRSMGKREVTRRLQAAQND